MSILEGPGSDAKEVRAEKKRSTSIDRFELSAAVSGSLRLN